MFNFNQPAQYDSTGAQEDINIYVNLSASESMGVIFMLMLFVITLYWVGKWYTHNK